MPPFFCPFRHRVQRQRGLARRIPARRSQPHVPSAGRRHPARYPARASLKKSSRCPSNVVLAQLHHRALAELALDLGERGGQGLGLIHGGSFDDTQGSGGHNMCSLWRGFASGTNGRWQVLDSTAYRSFVPRLFHVRNMFFFKNGVLSCFRPQWPSLKKAVA